MDDLISRLRALSRHEHSDMTIGDEAADALETAHVEREVIVAEAVKYADKSGRLEAKADRLAEALHKLEDSCKDSDDAQYGTLATSFVRSICKDALRDHDQVDGD